jgi:hypothetical protein
MLKSKNFEEKIMENNIVNISKDEEISALRQELETLRAEKIKRENKGTSLKVSQKGAVSLYGLGRFPVTLYRSQWEKILSEVGTIKDFIERNASSLSVKE